MRPNRQVPPALHILMLAAVHHDVARSLQGSCKLVRPGWHWDEGKLYSQNPVIGVQSTLPPYP